VVGDRRWCLSLCFFSCCQDDDVRTVVGFLCVAERERERLSVQYVRARDRDRDREREGPAGCIVSHLQGPHQLPPPGAFVSCVGLNPGSAGCYRLVRACMRDHLIVLACLAVPRVECVHVVHAHEREEVSDGPPTWTRREKGFLSFSAREPSTLSCPVVSCVCVHENVAPTSERGGDKR